MAALFLVVVVACRCFTHGFVYDRFSDDETDTDTRDVASGSGLFADGENVPANDSRENSKMPVRIKLIQKKMDLPTNDTMGNSTGSGITRVENETNIPTNDSKSDDDAKIILIKEEYRPQSDEPPAARMRTTDSDFMHWYRSLLRPTRPPCSTRNITLNTEHINWVGMVLRDVRSGKMRRVRQIILPFKSFNLTVCDGTCRGKDIESRVRFRGLNPKLLARLDNDVAVKLGLETSPCCVPAETTPLTLEIRTNYVTEQGNLSYGIVEGLKNAVRCMCM
ncbi:uncharacterized protein LOC134188906 [Corticium candelabrum]|uniref:uncharacterized protein LOC134188906 n=1 Tax=Corticium candelabrum TaxID=121492 RepID=UPI002E27131F|nr:uncharacterized protein LOC134188906 [Corticium candelabrum]